MLRSVLLAVVVILAGCEVEQSYDGRAASAWRGDLKSRDKMVRWRALIVLTQMHNKEPALLRRALPDVLELLRDDEPLVRKQALMAVTKLGPEAKSALPDVLKMLRDSDPDTREWAEKAALAIDEQAAHDAGVR
jgi:vesicle coat complex subunit